MNTPTLAILCAALCLSSEPHKRAEVAHSEAHEQPATTFVTVHNNNCSPNESSGDDNSPKWYASPEWWLVILGFPTLFALAWQGIAASRAAQAASLNAQAVIDSERPWLILERIEDPHLVPFFEVPEQDRRLAHVIFKTQNYGKTPAKVRFVWCQLRITDYPVMPSIDLPEVVQPSQDYIFPQGISRSAEAQLAPSAAITPEDRDAVLKNHTKFLWLIGFVKYRDTFQRKAATPEYETRFCYLYETRTNAAKPYWNEAGPQDWNTAK